MDNARLMELLIVKYSIRLTHYRVNYFQLMFHLFFFYVTFHFRFTVEYVAAIVTALFKAQHCSTGGIDIFRAYFSMSYNQVFGVIQYSIAIALPLGVFNFILSVAWNYMDLFIIILASALSDKFKQLNEKLDTVKGKVCNNYCFTYQIRT